MRLHYAKPYQKEIIKNCFLCIAIPYQSHNMKIYEYIVFLTVLSEVTSSNPLAGCQKVNTYGYGYLQYFPVDILPEETPKGGGPQDPKARFYLEFYVKAAENAHILISENDKGPNGLEVLLGGGSNTFNQIRKLNSSRRRSTMTTVSMTKTVSQDEDRGFWIEIDSYNNLLVGKKGSTSPILYYHITFPFPARYFSFATWTNTKGEWHFACRKNLSPDGVERNATTTERLRNDLLTYYNPINFPENDGNSSKMVQVHLEANGLRLDETRGEFEISGIASLKWSDGKLIWDPNNYDNIDSIHVKPYLLWTPQLKVLNSATFEKTSFLTETGSALVKNTGEVNWRSPFHSITFCVIGHKKWPHDRHNCTLTIGFLTDPLKISLETMVLSTTIMSQWEILNPEENGSVSYADKEREGTIYFHFQRRNPSRIVGNFIVPPFLSAATLTLLSFWTDPNSVVRLFFCCGSVFILIATLIVLGNTVPTILSTETAGFYHLCVLFYVFPVLFFIGLKYFPDCIDLPQFATNFLKSRINEILFCLPKSQASPGLFNTKEEKQQSNNAFLISILLERLIFFIYFIFFAISFIIALVFLEVVL